MEQFSLEKYLENPSRKITTRYGDREVRIICTDRKDKRPIVALMIDMDDGSEYITSHSINGWIDDEEKYPDKRDLFFADEEEEPQSTEFSFGAFDSEFIKDEYLIPEGCEARIEGNKVIIEKIKEPASEDLEEAASKYVREDFHERSRADFKAGAEWQKQQMMKDAVEGEYWIGEIHLDTPIIQGYNDGDRIKFIIIKMNNE